MPRTSPEEFVVHLMRHGPAEDRASSGRDADRALTAEGRARTERVANKLRECKLIPRSIVASPLVRAEQTAKIVANEFGLPVRTELALAPDGHGTSLVTALREAGDNDVLLVGHQPDLSFYVSSLTAGRTHLEFKKSMVVTLFVRNAVGDAAGARWAVRSVLEPKDLSLREH